MPDNKNNHNTNGKNKKRRNPKERINENTSSEEIKKIIDKKAQISATPKPRRLTEKQENFCHYYLDCEGNASEAYRMAYNTENMMPESIWVNACKMANDAKVKQRIDQIREARRKASEIDRLKAEEVLWHILRSKPKDVFRQDPVTGKMRKRTPFQLSEETSHAIDYMEVDKMGNFRYKFCSKVEAFSKLAKTNGWEAPQQHDLNLGDSEGKRFVFGRPFPNKE